MFACDFLENFSIIKIFSLKIRVFCGEMVFYFPETIASFDIFSSHKTPNKTEQRVKSIFKQLSLNRRGKEHKNYRAFESTCDNLFTLFTDVFF
jgi:hypothetical protein